MMCNIITVHWISDLGTATGCDKECESTYFWLYVESSK